MAPFCKFIYRTTLVELILYSILGLRLVAWRS